jgi:hypothetical protein
MLGAAVSRLLLVAGTRSYVDCRWHHLPARRVRRPQRGLGYYLRLATPRRARDLGILLIVAGFVLISLAVSSGHRGVLIASVLAALFILGAAFSGASFLSFNDDPSSMVMAGLSAAALACYVLVLFQLAAGSWPTRLLLTVGRPRYRWLGRRASGDLARSVGEL